MFPNWKVMASKEFTPSIVRAGIALEPSAKDIQAAKSIHSLFDYEFIHTSWFMRREVIEYTEQTR